MIAFKTDKIVLMVGSVAAVRFQTVPRSLHFEEQAPLVSRLAIVVPQWIYAGIDCTSSLVQCVNAVSALGVFARFLWCCSCCGRLVLHRLELVIWPWKYDFDEKARKRVAAGHLKEVLPQRMTFKTSSPFPPLLNCGSIFCTSKH